MVTRVSTEKVRDCAFGIEKVVVFVHRDQFKEGLQEYLKQLKLALACCRLPPGPWRDIAEHLEQALATGRDIEPKVWRKTVEMAEKIGDVMLEPYIPELRIIDEDH